MHQLAASDDDRLPHGSSLGREVDDAESGSQALAQLAGRVAETSGLPAALIEFVLRDELAAGRVVERNGKLELVPEAFPAGTLEALRELAPELALDQGGGGAARRNGRPNLGWSVRSIATLSRLAEPRTFRAAQAGDRRGSG